MQWRSSGLSEVGTSREGVGLLNPVVIFVFSECPIVKKNMNFRFGQYFSNKDLWLHHIEEVRNNGGYVPPFISQAVETGAVDPYHGDFTNLKRRNFKFRGHFYKDFAHLASTDVPNSPSIYQFQSEVAAEIARLEARGGARFISERDALSPGSIVNPIQWERSPKPDGSWKTRFILHAKGNSFYSRPRFSLADISDEVHILAQFSELAVCDNSDCFYQIRITPAASKWLRFKVDFEGEPVRYMEMLVLGMGVSSSPYIVQSANRLLVEAYSFKFGVYCEVYWGSVAFT